MKVLAITSDTFGTSTSWNQIKQYEIRMRAYA